MIEQKTIIAGWANYPTVEARIFHPNSPSEAQTIVANNRSIIARGNGKSYGDASLGENVISSKNFNKILHFDAIKGIITCESGVLLSEILQIIVPKGWFFAVTPGIKYITVGGAIASDVHGKNHLTAGCFSNWLISFDLINGAGACLTCSKNENTDLFWQTCGGMGWTGVIVAATFQLKKICSTRMLQKTSKLPDLTSIFKGFETHQHFEYNAAWINTVPKGKQFGQGILYSNNHVEIPEEFLQFLEKKTIQVPFFAPSFLLNSLSIWAYNSLRYASANNKEEYHDIDACFYPLDAIGHWNRLYGRRGFVQYQFCVPETNAYQTFERVLHSIHQSGETPFLSVMKKHGDPNNKAPNSFPIRGYSLALDFPRTSKIFGLVKKLDDIIWNAGGKIYLTKDACSDGKMGRVNPDAFGESKFNSLLKMRILST